MSPSLTSQSLATPSTPSRCPRLRRAIDDEMDPRLEACLCSVWPRHRIRMIWSISGRAGVGGGVSDTWGAGGGWGEGGVTRGAVRCV